MTTRKTQTKAAPNADDSAQAPEAGEAAATQNTDAATQEPAKDPAAKEGTPDAKGKQGTKGKRQVLKVSARGETFRRAGLQFGREARTLYVDELSDDQLAALTAEPRLLVVQAEDEDEE